MPALDEVTAMKPPADRSAEAVVAVKNLWMRYGSTDVLKGIDFKAYQGEVLALLGPNGAGKTTTVEILEGFRMRSAGDVAVLGTDPAKGDEEWRSRLGVVLQSWRDHNRWRVRELLEHIARFYVSYSTADHPCPRNVDDLMETVGLTEHANRKIATLSGGQRRRLDVAIGIVGRPTLLFLDEPTAGFDPEVRRSFHDLVERLANEDTTILLTTHDLDEAEKLADRILILADGNITAEGSANELTAQVHSKAEVQWTRAGQRFSHSTLDATGFVRGLFSEHGEEIADLEIRRAKLEDAYMTMVQRHEAGEEHEAASGFAEEVR